MLSYQDTSYHDDATLRELLGLRPAPNLKMAGNNGDRKMESLHLLQETHRVFYKNT